MHRAATEKRAFIGIMGALTSLAAYGCCWQLKRYQESRHRWNRVLSELDSFTPNELAGYDAKHYPWMRENLYDWEYRLVKLTGYFKEERWFVRRAKDGRAGYSVFAPFVTAIDDSDLIKNTDANPNLEYGLMVDLGWVPKDHKKDVEMNTEPVHPLNASKNTDLLAENRHTSLANNKDHVVGLTEIIGLVKRGETKDATKGQVNFPEEGVYQFVNLDLMAKFFNVDGASQAYIERMIGDDDDESENLYPVPSTRDTFFKPYLLPRKHLEYASFWAGATTIGLSSILIYTLRK